MNRNVPPWTEGELLTRLLKAGFAVTFSYDKDVECWRCVLRTPHHEGEGAGADAHEAAFEALLSYLDSMTADLEET